MRRSADHRSRVLSVGTCVYLLSASSPPFNCTGKHRENMSEITIWQIPRRDLSHSISFFNSTEIGDISSRGGNRRWRNRERECLLPLNMSIVMRSEWNTFLISKEKAASLEGGICIIDCTTNDSSIAVEMRDYRTRGSTAFDLFISADRNERVVDSSRLARWITTPAVFIKLCSIERGCISCWQL